MTGSNIEIDAIEDLLTAIGKGEVSCLDGVAHKRLSLRA